MVLEQEPLSGRYFGTVPAGVSASPVYCAGRQGGEVALFPGYLLWIPSIRRLYPRGTEQLY